MQTLPRIVLVLAAATATCFSAAGLAQTVTYRWTDAQGTTHYTQTPPAAGVYYDKVISKAEPTSKAASGDDTPAKPAEAEPVDAQAAAQKTACENARKNVALLSSDVPVRAAPPAAAEGGATAVASSAVLTPEQRAKELRRAQLQVELNCE